MKLKELLADCPVPIQVDGCADLDIMRVLDDSRDVRSGDLFVARAGTHADGASFITDAIGHGAVAILTDHPLPASAAGRVAGLHTADPAAVLGWLAHRINGSPAGQMRVFAVTGTNGKTTITYLVRSMLLAAGQRCGLIGTVQIDDGRQVVDSEITTPGPVQLAGLLAQMRANGATAVAMEASSHALDQNRLAGMDVHVAMFSNLTGDHLDYHGSMDQYAAAKARLFETLGPGSFAILNADDPYTGRMGQNTAARVITYGLTAEADFSAVILRLDATGMDLRLHGPNGMKWPVRSSLVGRHNVQNILCATAAAWCVGLEPQAMATGLRNMTGVPGRLQAVIPAGLNRADLPFQVLVDYAHTHDALENVLKAVRPWTRGRIICVFGCGGGRDAVKRPKMAAVAERLADVIVVTSDNPRSEDPQAIIADIQAGFSPAIGTRLHVQPDRGQAITEAVEMAQPGDVVLLAGKGHEKYQIVGGQKRHFDDVEEAQHALVQKR